MIRIYPLIMQMKYGLGKRYTIVPLLSTVIRLPDLLIICDTGYAQKPDLVDRLNEIGLCPDDFDLVINTHVHPDHVGNNQLFKNADIVVSRTDYNFAKSYSHALIESDDPVKTFSTFYPSFSLRLAEKYTPSALRVTKKYWHDDILGDNKHIKWIEENPELPSPICLWHTPGHTPGHYAVEIKGKNNRLLITGDALPGRLFWKSHLRGLSPQHNPEQYKQSKSRIEEFTGIILGGHDRPFNTITGNYIEDQEIILE